MKKNEYLSDALTHLDEDLIQQTDAVRDQRRRQPHWPQWVAAAVACVVLTACAGAYFLPMLRESPVPSTPEAAPVQPEQLPEQAPEEETPAQNTPQRLPVLEIQTDVFDSMGFEGYDAYNASELVSANPWRADVTALPVYQNRTGRDHGDNVLSPEQTEELRLILTEIAGRLNLKPDSYIITDDTPVGEEKQIVADKLDGESPEGMFPTRLILNAENVRIEIDKARMVSIEFTPARTLQQELSADAGSSYEGAAALADWLKGAYGDLLDMEQPKANISGGDYHVSEDESGRFTQRYNVAFYDAAGEPAEQIVNYAFRQAEFLTDEAGNLWIIRLHLPDLSGKIGEYPLITQEQARELLTEGQYLTSAPYELPSEDCIERAELVYRTGDMCHLWMPYYRFYVRLEDAEHDPALPAGMATYGAYYVPAIQSQYLSWEQEPAPAADTGTDVPEEQEEPAPDRNGQSGEAADQAFVYKGLVDLFSIDDTFVLEQKYATADNFTGTVQYDRTLCLVNEDIVDRLIAANDLAKEQGLRLKIWDAYRPISVQQALHDSAPPELSAYVPAPGPYSMHARGITVDVTLCQPDGTNLDMPTDFDDFSPAANSDDTGATEQQIQNRELLNAIMTQAGFTRSALEWWHFDGPNRDNYEILDVSFSEYEQARMAWQAEGQPEQ